jgi:hypothetical protein
VPAIIKGNEKENFTVVAAGTATGNKLPLKFIASGKMIRVERTQIGQGDGHWRSHSQNGWQTSETFRNYFVNLQCKVGPEPIYLFLGSYSAHRTDQVKAVAERLGITLHATPAGLTYEFQPLDRAPFGILKAGAKRLFHTRFHANSYSQRTQQAAIADMITVWSLPGGSAIEDTGDIYNQ